MRGRRGLGGGRRPFFLFFFDFLLGVLGLCRRRRLRDDEIAGRRSRCGMHRRTRFLRVGGGLNNRRGGQRGAGKQDCFGCHHRSKTPEERTGNQAPNVMGNCDKPVSAPGFGQYNRQRGIKSAVPKVNCG
jgi:hypothetical protein